MSATKRRHIPNLHSLQEVPYTHAFERSMYAVIDAIMKGEIIDAFSFGRISQERAIRLIRAYGLEAA